MAENNTQYIKLARNLKNKAFYSKDSEKVHLWVHLILCANWQEKEEMLGGKPITCLAGQFTTGRKQLSTQTGISESKIERILTYFEKIEQQIEQQKTSTNRLISILNWDKYQQSEQSFEQRVNNDRTTSEQRVNNDRTTSEHTIRIEEYKEYKNIKNKKKRVLLSEIKISDVTHQNYFKIALEFQKLIRQNIIELKASTRNIDLTKSDAIDDIRLLIENDKFTEDDCRYVYNFLKENQFWKKNILSIKKLREKFNKLLIEAKNGNSEIQQSNSGYRKNTAGNNAEDKKRSVDRLADMAEAILQNT